MSTFLNALRRKKRSPSPVARAARWTLGLSLSLYLTWALLFPSSSGALGSSLHAGLTRGLGATAYLLPVLLGYGAFRLGRSQKGEGRLVLALGSLLVLACTALLLAFPRPPAFFPEGLGGLLGSWALKPLASIFGRAGSLLLGLGAWLVSTRLLFGVSWLDAFTKTWTTLLEDYRAFSRDRADFKKALREGEQARKGKELAPVLPAPIQALRSQDAQAPMRSAEPPKLPRAEEPKAPKAVKTARAKEAAASEGGGGTWSLPPLSLLEARKGEGMGGRPSDQEIRQAVESLEKTLQSFEIQAHVSGISPGPVITRYEVTPAPGVTVNSIVTRASDIALTMRAKGIRMIAPIPGKAAIGIEIPNQAPAMVTLREVLESAALRETAAPLAFALGLSSDGLPAAADLQSMPHVLVAGATNSGKSVAIHSLIASILLRQFPDQVKFLLIDPKRIELTFYEGIPHLYDPKLPSSAVQVVTQAKEAAKSLKALVRVMEQRYAKFQEYRVRDIRGYNEEARKRGEASEFHIVVVIDELADLMVVAKDVVEDSIQRLAQMARAVGIHLVLATQRPSVDVITGVIKANLPTRIALRVASKVDSKVILDGNGAEALLGRGDMLYLSPGQDLLRMQGCYVGTREIAALVDHWRAQGAPQYPTLETMSAVGEADLSQFGVEPLEFTQALKLVLERRRVSQDLLKSQFGSSARATNLLSLLEVKAFIHKPEGSNRWDIHFDKIEDYLRAHYPQAMQKPGI